MKEKHSRPMISLQLKLSGIFIMASILIFIVNAMLVFGINRMTSEMDMVYRDNLKLNALTVALNDVQNNMSDYLNTKTTDSLQAYYKSEQAYFKLISELNGSVTPDTNSLMERNIKNMSEEYLTTTENAIDAKRGRNVEKYSAEYDRASRLYEYINTYIYSLNNERFKSNSESFSELIKAFRVFEVVSIIVMLGAVVGTSAFVLGFTKTMIDPVRKLARAADEVAKGNFEIETLPISSNDEIGVVTGTFNKMVVSIRQYIEQIKENMEHERKMQEKELKTEATLKEAQLKYLQTQINPHFLFNTLNAGAQLAMMEDAEKTYNYIQNTAAFFRYNVREGYTTVRLSDEINLIDHYIYILNVRFSGDIKYEKTIDKSVLDVLMPSMILQPIIENSVNHGIKEMEGKGKITLDVYAEDDDVCISVKDNGIGMTKEMIKKVLSGELTEEEKAAPVGAHGIGMDNVIKRIRLFTEREDSVSIFSDGEGMGTEVLIRLSRNNNSQIVSED
ncbi:MAG: histidine kinase [Lachnospiraceae bacterium]|nr:histidine kinase [Lachnospiraceae bacterium]